MRRDKAFYYMVAARRIPNMHAVIAVGQDKRANVLAHDIFVCRVVKFALAH